MFIQVKKTQKKTGAVEERIGTGFVISTSGYLLTNKHVVESDSDVDEIEITGAIASRYSFASRLMLIDSNEHDIALLKFADTSKTYGKVKLGRASEANVGSHFCSGSFTAGQEFFLAEGSLSGKGADHGYWFTQMTSNPGDSGAPVFMVTGRVVALKVGGYESLQNVNLVIPLNLARNLLDEVPDPDPDFPPPELMDRITVSRENGSYRVAEFIASLRSPQLQITMEANAARDLARKKVKIHTEGITDVPLRYVIDNIVLPQLPPPKNWSYVIVGKTLIIKRGSQ